MLLLPLCYTLVRTSFHLYCCSKIHQFSKSYDTDVCLFTGSIFVKVMLMLAPSMLVAAVVIVATRC